MGSGSQGVPPSVLLSTPGLLIVSVKRHFISPLCICLPLSAGPPCRLQATPVYPWMVKESGPWDLSHPE